MNEIPFWMDELDKVLQAHIEKMEAEVQEEERRNVHMIKYFMYTMSIPISQATFEEGVVTLDGITFEFDMHYFTITVSKGDISDRVDIRDGISIEEQKLQLAKVMRRMRDKDNK